jgi:hypothetical protein
MIPVSVTGKEGGATAHTLARFKLTQFVMTGGSFNKLMHSLRSGHISSIRCNVSVLGACRF